MLADRRADEVQLASWPAPASLRPAAGADAAGGHGLGPARRSASGADALDIELRGLDAFGPDRIERQALRLGVGGRTVLGDLDEGPGLPSGFDRASVSRNTVVINALNQRESPGLAREPAPGGNFLFFAADPDFQVVTLDDPRSYPVSTTRYRQTVVASAGPRSAVRAGGLRGPRRAPARPALPRGGGLAGALAALGADAARARRRCCPPGLTFVPSARAEDGRWFVQAYAEFSPLAVGPITRPAGLARRAGDAKAAVGPSGIRCTC